MDTPSKFGKDKPELKPQIIEKFLQAQQQQAVNDAEKIKLQRRELENNSKLKDPWSTSIIF